MFIIDIGILMTVSNQKYTVFYLKQNHEIKTVQTLNDLILIITNTYFVLYYLLEFYLILIHF